MLGTEQRVMSATIKIIRDEITPGLGKLSQQIRNMRPFLEAMGTSLVSIVKRTFSDQYLRIKEWPPNRRDSKSAAAGMNSSALRRSGALWQSITITKVTDHSVTVGTDRPYASFHQYGTKPYVIRPKFKKVLAWPGATHPVGKVNHPGLPARPFFPFSPTGAMSETAKRLIRGTLADKMKALGFAGG